MDKPCVSVVIPSYNSGALLERAVGSVLAQTAANIEVLVVDDGSATAPSSIVQLDGRVRLHSQRNQGVSAARNVGVAMASADLIAFLDHDDEWLPNKLERQLELVDRVPDAAFWCTGYTWVRGTQEIPSDRTAPTYHGLLATGHVLLSSLLVRRIDYQRVGGHDLLLAQMQDWDLALKLCLSGRAPALVDEQLVRYHLHGSNASGDYRRAATERMAILAAHARRAARRGDRRTRTAIQAGRARTRELFAYQAIDAARGSVRQDARSAMGHFMFAARTSPRVAAQSVTRTLVDRARSLDERVRRRSTPS